VTLNLKRIFVRLLGTVHIHDHC